MMTPEFTIRTFTDDQYVLDKIFYANNYRLKKFPEEGESVVVDIGAHTGFFSLLCLMRNATQVYSVEPFGENYRILSRNTEAFADKLTSMKLGIYTETKFARLKYPKPENNFFFLSHIGFYDGEEEAFSETCHFIKLDTLLGGLTEEKVDLLKIHIGYGEADILLSSEKIDKCRFVCGETSANEKKLKELVQYMTDKGFQDSFLSKSKEKEELHMFVFAKDSCQELFDIYAPGSAEEADQQQAETDQMTKFSP